MPCARHNALRPGQFGLYHSDRSRRRYAARGGENRKEQGALQGKRHREFGCRHRQRDGRGHRLHLDGGLRDSAARGLRAQTFHRLRAGVRDGHGLAHDADPRPRDRLRRLPSRQLRRGVLRRHHTEESHREVHERGGCRRHELHGRGALRRLREGVRTASLSRGRKPRARSRRDFGRSGSESGRGGLFRARERGRVYLAALRALRAKGREKDIFVERDSDPRGWRRHGVSPHRLPAPRGHGRHGAHPLFAAFRSGGKDGHGAKDGEAQHRRLVCGLHHRALLCCLARQQRHDRTRRRTRRHARRAAT